MNRKLLLLRHGKSDWSKDTSDFDRPLKKRGRQASKQMGFWLEKQKMIPDYLISSPAKRARSTVENLTLAMGFPDKKIYFDSQLYAADLDDLLAVLANCPENAKKILLVGHNPELEELLVYLHKGELEIPDDGKLLPTATLAILNVPDDLKSLSAGCAELVSITRPAELSQDD